MERELDLAVDEGDGDRPVAAEREATRARSRRRIAAFSSMRFFQASLMNGGSVTSALVPSPASASLIVAPPSIAAM